MLFEAEFLFFLDLSALSSDLSSPVDSSESELLSLPDASSFLSFSSYIMIILFAKFAAFSYFSFFLKFFDFLSFNPKFTRSACELL